MSLTDAKVRGLTNLLSDPLQAHAAAHLLSEEARARGLLVADLIAKAISPAQPSTAPAPKFSDVNDDRIDVAIGKRTDFNAYGLRAEVLGETDRAWLARTPGGGESWLPKSQCQHHGADAVGRAIFIVPARLWKKKGFFARRYRHAKMG
jgi:plasmid stability protein